MILYKEQISLIKIEILKMYMSCNKILDLKDYSDFIGASVLKSDLCVLSDKGFICKTPNVDEWLLTSNDHEFYINYNNTCKKLLSHIDIAKNVNLKTGTFGEFDSRWVKDLRLCIFEYIESYQIIDYYVLEFMGEVLDLDFLIDLYSNSQFIRLDKIMSNTLDLSSLGSLSIDARSAERKDEGRNIIKDVITAIETDHIPDFNDNVNHLYSKYRKFTNEIFKDI
jgi:hypothetical protein